MYIRIERRKKAGQKKNNAQKSDSATINYQQKMATEKHTAEPTAHHNKSDHDGILG